MSGALAGLAGGIEVTGVTYALYENLSPGYGFSAIAVAILAGLRPLAVLITAIVFAIIETGALGMQRDAGVPSVVASVIEASIILVVVAASGGLGGLQQKIRRARPLETGGAA
jgi:simple sugar transport system permease protein